MSHQASGSSGAPVIELAPSDLLAGDLVLVDGNWARVLTEAMTMHRGLGMFDDFQVFVGTRIEFVGTPGSQAWTWEPTDRVRVRRAKRST
jgi:hypothetical protein